jgi:hypothetical protein
MLVNEDDSLEFPKVISYDVNRYLASPRNNVAGDDN